MQSAREYGREGSKEGAGVAGGAGAANLIRSVLYGTKPLDPAVFVTMAGTLLLVALLACALPALRASKIEPMQALRVE